MPDFDLDYDGERTLTVTQGTRSKCFRVPIPLDRGVWSPGKVPGKLLVIWDGASIHHGHAVKDFLAAAFRRSS